MVNQWTNQPLANISIGTAALAAEAGSPTNPYGIADGHPTPWEITGVGPNQNEYVVGTMKWVQFQQHYGLATDPALAAQQKQVWQEQQNIKQMAKLKRYPLLQPSTGTLKRRLAQPKFKFSFDRSEDAHLRLTHSLITVGADLYHVRDVFWIDNKPYLVLENAAGKSYRLPYEDDSIDLRTPDPQYYMHEDVPMYYIRVPARQQAQGLTGRNVVVKRVGEYSATTFESQWNFMKGMKNTQTVLWSPVYADIIVKLKALRSIRLSPAVAFYRDKHDKLTAEFRGRRLGAVHDDEIYVDEDDYSRSWIKKEIQLIGCVVKPH